LWIANGDMAIRFLGMRTRPAALFVAALFAAFTFSTQPSVQAHTFGTSGNEFTIDFVNIGNLNNAADTTGFGATLPFLLNLPGSKAFIGLHATPGAPW